MEHIGEQIIRWRRRRGGMTQRMLADRAGLTQSYVSKLEAGLRVADRRSTQVALARALNISVRQLLGDVADDADPMRERALVHVPAIRSALFEVSAGERRRPERDADQLRAATRKLTECRNAADYAVLAPQLPDLLLDLAGYGPDLTPQLVGATFAARYVLKAMGHSDLSMQAAQIGVLAAEGYDSPAWLAQARYSWVQALPPESAQLGVRLLLRAADQLQSDTSRDGREMYGCLHVLAAHSAAVVQDAASAAAHLDEAADVAAVLGEPERYGELSAGINGNWFGPTQVEVWRVAVAAELADVGAAMAVSRRIDLSSLPLPNRHVFYWTDLARVMATDGEDVAALHALAKAERAAPQHFRFNPVARNLVSTLVNRAQHNAVSPNLRALAGTLGIYPI